MKDLKRRLTSCRETTDWQNPHDGVLPRQEWFVEKILSFCSGVTLDLGCGHGVWSRKIREQVISVDLSMRRLRKCQAEGNSDNMVCASSTDLPFDSASFDAALFLEVIEHMDKEKQNKSLKEIYRVLKPGGVIVITTPNKPMYHLITRRLHLFPHNPEHVRELSYREAKELIGSYFNIISIDGKLGFLDRFVPTFLCWDMLLVGKKP